MPGEGDRRRTPCGATGATEELFDAVVRGEYDMAGTFNGNPLTMAASRAALTEVLTTDAYRTFNAIDAAMKEGLGRVIDEHLPAYVTGVGAKWPRSTRRRRCASTVTRSAWTSASHTSPGCSSRTAGSSSRRGRSRRPGRSRCGTRTRTPGGTSRTRGLRVRDHRLAAATRSAYASAVRAGWG